MIIQSSNSNNLSLFLSQFILPLFPLILVRSIQGIVDFILKGIVFKKFPLTIMFAVGFGYNLHKVRKFCCIYNLLGKNLN